METKSRKWEISYLLIWNFLDTDENLKKILRVLEVSDTDKKIIFNKNPQE